MMYDLTFTNQAKEELDYFKRTNSRCFKKIEQLLDELMVHPTRGTGRPKPLRHDPPGRWARRIDQEHRLIYSISEQEVVVEVLSMRFHYEK